MKATLMFNMRTPNPFPFASDQISHEQCFSSVPARMSSRRCSVLLCRTTPLKSLPVAGFLLRGLVHHRLCQFLVSLVLVPLLTFCSGVMQIVLFTHLFHLMSHLCQKLHQHRPFPSRFVFCTLIVSSSELASWAIHSLNDVVFSASLPGRVLL